MIKRAVRYHYDKLTTEELSFLNKKEEKERVQFYKVLRTILIICFVVPYVVSWFRATEGVPDPFSFTYYFSGVGFLMVFSGSIAYFIYRNNLNKIQRDIKKRSKTVEHTHITRKQFMPQTNTYYFYLDSPTKLSIEVSQQDYESMRQGDELNIEYTTHAKFYLGYF